MLADAAQNDVKQPDAELIFGKTPEMREIRRKLELAIEDDLPLLIEGESGTGKEVTARFVHRHSAREGRPFVKVSCGALPQRLLELEMFGAETGIASGAHQSASAIAMAAGGTLYLDEIGDLEPLLQHRLIRTMLDRQSGQTYEPASVRFVCASSMDLERKAAENPVLCQFLGLFGYRVRLLPLRERRCDIPQLCEFILQKFARNFGRPVPSLSPSILEAFARRNWPGNIRELENWIARIVVFGIEEALESEPDRQRGSRNDGGFRRHRATRIGLNRRRRRFS